MLNNTPYSVIVFTYRSPFGPIPEFIEDEIPFWNEAARVLVISLAKRKERRSRMTNNAMAYAVSPAPHVFATMSYLLSGLLTLSLANEIRRILSMGLSGVLSRLIRLGIHIQAVERYYKGALQLLTVTPTDPSETIVLYSYWCGPATHAAIQLKASLSGRNVLVLTRTHGSDLYEHAAPQQYLPFQRTVMSACDRIFPVSTAGARYAETYWHCPPARVTTARLGTPDYFRGHFPERGDWFHLLSCSYVVPIKRVHMIAEALSGVTNARIQWTHIGGGVGLERLRDTCRQLLGRKPNIRYELRGDVSHAAVIDTLREDNVNALVNVSSSEGIPVSMIEAHCCAVPVIAPDVGGVGEIVTSAIDGVLMSTSPSLVDIETAILWLIDLDDPSYRAVCKNARWNWVRRYSAAANYELFTSQISTMCSSVKTART